MADFRAKIIAELDTAQAESKLKSFESGTHKLKLDLELSSANSALLHFINNMNAQMKNAGQSAGSGFASAFGSGIKSLNLNTTKSQIDNLKNTLATMKFDKSSVNTITKDLDNMNLAIKNVTTNISGGNLRIQVQGIDELGRAVTVVKEFDVATGNLSDVSRRISQSFSGFSGDFSKQIKSIYESLDTEKIEAKITSLQTKMQSYDPGSAQYKQLEQTLQEVQKQYETLKQARDSFDKNGDMQSGQAMIVANERLTESMKKAENEMKILQTTQSKLITDQQRASAEKGLTTYFETNTKAAKKYATEVENLQKQLANAKTTDDLNKFKTDFTNLQTTITKNGDLGKGFAEMFSSASAAVGSFIAQYLTIQTVIGITQNVVLSVMELDAALTNISYTMDLTDSQFEQIATSSANMAKELGSSVTSVLQAVQLYANANETADSILQKAQTAVMISNVTDMSSTEAAKTLQAVMNQFDMTQDELMSISDTIQSVSQNMAYDFSSGVKEIASGIQISGSIAKEAGLDLAEYSSMLGLVIEQTGQSGSTIGRAFSTIFQRITKASSTSGTLEEDISKAEESLRAVGIEVREDEDNFRDLRDILGELAEKWDTLNDVQKGNISFNVAGTRQTNILKTLMKNHGDYLDMVEKAQNADGTTIENNDKHLESIQGHIDTMKATWQGFSQSLLDSSFIKGIVDIGTLIGNVFSTIQENFGILGTVIAGVSLAAFTGQVLSAITGVQKLGALASGLSSAFTGLAGVLGVSSGALLGIFGAIAAGIIVFDKFHVSAKEASEAFDQSFSAFEGAKQNVDDVTSQLETMKGQIDELEARDSLTFVEQQELENLREATELLTLQAELAKEERRIAASEAADDAVRAYNKNFDTYDANAIDDYLAGRWNKDYVVLTGGDVSENLNSYLAAYKGVTQERDAAWKEVKGFADDLKNLNEEQRAEYLEGLTDEQRLAYDNYEMYAEWGKSIEDVVLPELSTLVDYRSKLEELSKYTDLTPEQASTLQAINDTIDGAYQMMRPEQWKQMKLDELFNVDALANAKQGMLDLATAQEGVGITAEQIKEAYPDIEQALSEFNELNGTSFTLDDIVMEINAEAKVLNLDEVRSQAEEQFESALTGEDGVETDVNVEGEVTVNEGGMSKAEFTEWLSTLNDAQTQYFYEVIMKTEGWESLSKDELQSMIDGMEATADEAYNFTGKIEDAFHMLTDESFSTAIKGYKEDLDTLQTALDKFNSGELTSSDLLELQNQFEGLMGYDLTNVGTGIEGLMQSIIGKTPEVTAKLHELKQAFEDSSDMSGFADTIKENQLTLEDFINACNNEGYNLSDGARNAVSNLLTSAKELGVITDLSETSVLGLGRQLVDLGILAQEDGSYVEQTISLMDAFQKAIDAVGGKNTEAGKALIGYRDTLLSLYDANGKAIEGFTEFKQHISDVEEAQKNVADAVHSSNAEYGLTAEQVQNVNNAYKNLESYDPSKLFLNTATGVRLNMEEVKKLNQELSNNTEAEILDKIRDAEIRLGQARANNQDTSGIEAEIAAYRALQSQYEATLGAYNAYINAKSTTDERSALEGIGKDYESMKQLYENGWWNNDDLQSYLDLLLGDHRTGDVQKDWESLNNTIGDTGKSMLDFARTYDENGNMTSEGMWDFLHAAQQLRPELASINDETGEGFFDLSGDNLHEWAEALGTSEDMIRLIGKALQEADYGVHWGVNAEGYDEAIADISEAQELMQQLDEAEANPDVEIDADATQARIIEIIDELEGMPQETLIELGFDVNEDGIVTREEIEAQIGEIELDAEVNPEVTDVPDVPDGEMNVDAHVDEAPEVPDGTMVVDGEAGEQPEFEDTSVSVDGETGEQPEFDDTSVSVDGEAGNQPTFDDQTVNVTANQTGGASFADQSVNVSANVTSQPTFSDATVNVTPNVTQQPQFEAQTVDVTPNVTAQPQFDDQTVNVSANTDGLSVPDLDGTANYSLGDSPSSVPDAQGTANFVLGNSPNTVPDASGKANYSLGSAPTTAPTISGKANYSLGSYPTTAPTIYGTAVYTKQIKAQGTATSIKVAHADGTAYNAPINYKRITPAHANGNIALEKDEEALVNELGNESIVRDGVWSIIPGGAHVENLKKGDIIFNVAQTEELLKFGKITSGAKHGKLALAKGTYNGMPAYGKVWNSTIGGTGGGYQAPSGGTTHTSTTTNNSNTSTSTKDKTVDWIVNKLNYFADKVVRIANTITDYVSDAVRKSKLIQQRSAIDEQIGANETAYTKYMNKAGSVKLSADLKKKVREGDYSIKSYDEKTQKKIQEYEEYYNKAMACKDTVVELRNEQLRLFDELMHIPADKAAKKIQKLAASYDTLSAKASAASSGMSGIMALESVGQSSMSSVKKDYQAAKDARTTAKNKYTSAQAVTQVWTAEKTKATKATTAASKKLTKSDKKVKKDKNGYYILNGLKKSSAQYKRLKAYNDSLKYQKAVEAKEATAKSKEASAKTAYSAANTAYSASKATYDEFNSLYGGSSSGKKTYEVQNSLIDQQTKNLKSQNTANQTALKEATSNVTDAQNAKNAATKNVTNKANSILKSYSKNLTAAQKKALQEGKAVSTKGLSGKALSAVQAYNKLVTTASTKSQELTLALDAQEEAANNAAQSAADLAQAMVEAEQEKFANVKNYYDSQLDYLDALNSKQQALNDLRSAKGIEMNADDYKTLVSNTKTQITTLQEEAKKLKSQLASAVKSGVIKEGSEEWREMQNQILAVETATYNAQKEQVEYNNAILNLPFQNIEKAISLLDTLAENLKSKLSLKNAKGLDLSVKDYTDQMKANTDKIAQIQQEKSRAYTYYLEAMANADGVYAGKTAQEWREQYLNFDSDINNLLADNEELKKSMRDDVYWRNFERAHEVCKNLQDVLSGIADLIDEDMMFDKDGNFTNYGIAQISNLTKQYETAREEINNYQKDIANLNKLYKEGWYAGDEGLREYQDKLADLQNGLLDTASNMKKLTSALVDMYRQSAEAELESLDKLIDARAEALQKKKDYYDYDKQIKSQTNDIQNLSAQLAALEGISTNEAKAQRAKLEAELAEKQSDLDDTVNDHLFDLSKDALDGLRDTLQEAFDDKWDNISGDLEKLAELMAAANDLSSASTATVVATLNKLLKDGYGIDAHTTGIDAHFASGTKRVPKKMTALTNESGGELIITKDGIITPLEAGDGVVPAELTRRLYDMAINGYNPQVASMSPTLPGIGNDSIGSTSVVQNYDSLIHIDGSADAATVEDLKRISKNILEESYNYTTKKIYGGYIRSGGKRQL